jgi:hypothetical protein
VFLDGFDRRWLEVIKSFANLLGHDPKQLVGVTASADHTQRKIQAWLLRSALAE